MSRQQGRRRGSFGQWSTENAPGGAVHEVNGWDAITQTVIDAGWSGPAEPRPLRARRRGRRAA